MNKHFAYLIQSDESDFFQKVAGEQAESRRPPASTSMMKTAMQSLLEGVTFEKVAARLDRDIHILKTAGASGMNMGMQKRAGAYIDQLLEQCEFEPNEFDQIFEKVAGEAIMGDLVVAQSHLSQDLDDDGLAWLDGELTKIGAELTELAMLEKEAFLGAALRAIGAVGKAVVGRGAKAVGRGIAAPFRGVASLAGKTPGAIRDFRIARGTKSLAKTEAALAKARTAQTAMRAQGKGSGVMGAGRDAGVKSLEGSVEKTRAKLQQLGSKKMQAEGGRLVAGANPASAKGNTWTTLKAQTPPKASPKVESPSAPRPTQPSKSLDSPGDRTEIDAAQKRFQERNKTKVPATGGDEAAKAAAKPKTDTPSNVPAPAPKGSGADDLSMNATKGEGVTMKGSYEKLRDKGWKALDSAEKQKLINAGIATVVGGRVVLGHGVLTGGEGIV